MYAELKEKKKKLLYFAHAVAIFHIESVFFLASVDLYRQKIDLTFHTITHSVNTKSDDATTDPIELCLVLVLIV